MAAAYYSGGWTSHTPWQAGLPYAHTSRPGLPPQSIRSVTPKGTERDGTVPLGSNFQRTIDQLREENTHLREEVSRGGLTASGHMADECERLKADNAALQAEILGLRATQPSTQPNTPSPQASPPGQGQPDPRDVQHSLEKEELHQMIRDLKDNQRFGDEEACFTQLYYACGEIEHLLSSNAALRGEVRTLREEQSSGPSATEVDMTTKLAEKTKEVQQLGGEPAEMAKVGCDDCVGATWDSGITSSCCKMYDKKDGAAAEEE
eukprot:gene1072-2639_t